MLLLALAGVVLLARSPPTEKIAILD